MEHSLNSQGWTLQAPGTTATGMSQLMEFWYSKEEQSSGFLVGDWYTFCLDWQYNASEGKRHFDWLATQFTTTQQGWTDAQKLDLQTYGYKHGPGNMKKETTTWDTVDNDPYVNIVRQIQANPPY